MNPYLRIAPLLVVLLLSFCLAIGLFRQGPPNPVDKETIGKHFADFTLPIIGNDKLTFTPKTTAGQVVVVNVFASWCEPCAAEHDVLMKLVAAKKVNVYGIAWKDTPENIAAYLQKRGNPFQLIGLDKNGVTTLPLGLSGIPETFVLDKTGAIAYHYKSALSEEQLNNVILPLVDKLQKANVQAH